MTRENTASKTATQQEQPPVALPDWLKFPTLAEAFEESPVRIIAHLETRRKEYQSLEANGTAADRVRARLISASYARTCALLQELNEMQVASDKNKQHNR